MAYRSKRRTTSLAVKAAELAVAVPQVVAHRITRMTLAGPSLSKRDRTEFHRMGAEKTVAFSKSWNAMTVQALRASHALSVSFLRSLSLTSLLDKPSPGAVAARLHNAVVSVVSKGIAPVHRTAVANAKRLSRTKLR
jgi:hypothetical protein